MKEIYVALENLRSLYNIGAIFRTCSFFGVKNVILVGYSGKRFNTLGQPILHDQIKKSSLGAEESLNIIFLETSSDLIKFAKENHLKLVSAEQHPDSTSLNKWKVSDKTVLVFGNEVEGVSKEVLSSSNQIIEVVRTGVHNSLNVTTVCGIVLFAVRFSSPS